mgnify:CR=1 FL=1
MKLEGKNKPVEEQMEILHAILKEHTKLYQILKALEKSGLPNYYLAAGCINQTVFNYYHDFPLDYGIKDFDIVYFDPDVSYKKEDAWIKILQNKLGDLKVETDIKNEARVPLWYKEKFGKEIKPYYNVEEAISRWGTTITCLGVRLEKNHLVVAAPYGLNDLFELTIRPVKKGFNEKSYQEKVQKWKKKWPLLKIIAWKDL